MKFSIKDFLLKKFLIESFFFLCAVTTDGDSWENIHGLTFLFPMQHFYTPENTRTLGFSDVFRR